MGPLRILVDADEVLFGWNRHLDDEMNKYSLLDGVPRTHQRVGWDLFEGLSVEQSRAMHIILNRSGFYAALRPLPGAQAAMTRLRQQGHKLFIVTTPYHSNPTCADDKLRSIERFFGQTMRKRTVITDDKTIVAGDVLIDDRPEIVGDEAEPSWTRIVFDQPWNREIKGFTRLRSWDDKAVDAALLDAVMWK